MAKGIKVTEGDFDPPISLRFKGKDVEFDGSCPECGSDMWDNRKTKKKAWQSDFRCIECEAVVRLPEPKKAESGAKPNNQVVNTDAMLLSYAKDLTIAKVYCKLFEGDPLVDLAENFKFMKKLLAPVEEEK